MSSAADFLSQVKTALGDPYQWGGTGPAAFDCSGLIQWAARKAGFKGVPRTSEQQWSWVRKIKASELQPGDLVFSDWGDGQASPSHVAVYAGSGKLIEAPQPGQNVHEIPLDGGYKQHVTGYGRMPGVKGGASDGGGLLPGGLLSLGLPSDVLGAFTAAEKIAQGALWWINPENWARIVAGVLGLFIGLFGIGFLIAAGV